MKTDVFGFFVERHRLKKHQRKDFMEKRVKKSPKRTKPDSEEEEKTITITILIAIVILVGLLIFLALTPAPKAPFAAIYMLDSEKQTENFPKTVVLGENSTFTLWIGVENQNDTTMDFSVYVKLDNGTGPDDPSPANITESFKRILLDKQVWEFQVTINIDQLGDHRIIFELWYFDETVNDYEYSGNWVSLSLQAT